MNWPCAVALQIYAPWLIRLAVLIAVVLAQVAGAAGAETQRTKRILMLFSESKFVHGNVLVEQGARDALQESDRTLDFYAEYLDAGRFADETHYRLFREYLQEKYSRRPPDLVIAFLATKFELAGKLPAEIFPKVPVVFAALTEEAIPDRLGSNVTGVVQRMDFSGALALILKVQPDTERIIVIGGTAPLDHLYVARTQEASRSLAARVNFEFWHTRTVARMRRDIASLPRRTVILLTTVFRDAAGETFSPEAVAGLLAASSSVPIFVLGDPMIGLGVVGGAVAHLEALGKRSGELARAVLDGTPPALLPVEVRQEGTPMFDWRALKRWHITEGRLPPGSIVRFRPPSMWEQYRWYIVATLVVIVIQTALIVGLLLQRARRRWAEAELQRNRDQLAHVTRVSTVGELTTAIAHELNQPLGAILSNAEAAEMFLKMEPPELDEIREILVDIRKDDERASEVIRRVRGLLRKQELAPQQLEINAAVEEALMLLSANASARKVKISYERLTDHLRVWFDPVHLQQVLLNLLLNGIEATGEIPEEQRQLVLQTRKVDHGTVQVSVSDFGRGIPAGKLADVFEPFFTTKKEGMGMGLSIARTIVEEHGGRIWAENNSAGGASFHFTVAIATEAKS